MFFSLSVLHIYSLYLLCWKYSSLSASTFSCTSLRLLYLCLTMCMFRIFPPLFPARSLLSVDWGSVQCSCVIRLLIPTRQRGSMSQAVAPLQHSITNSPSWGFAQSHQLPHAASSVQTIISCLRHRQFLLYWILKSCPSLCMCAYLVANTHAGTCAACV